MSPALFAPLTIRGVTLRNRIGVSSMCQYSATDGRPNHWHLVHLGSRAVGGAGLVFTEATAVTPEGRIAPEDTGVWSDAHADAWAPIAAFVAEHGAVPGMQLAHAGFKGSTYRPWDERKGGVPDDLGGWTPVGPGATPFGLSYRTPHALLPAEIESIVDAFAAAAARAVRAGFRVVEVHAAHGYLLHEFLSPLSNQRDDAYGGPREHRMRLVLDVVRAVRAAVGDDVPVFTRVSATDWVDGGWSIEDTVALARALLDAGVDVVDCSTGGVAPQATIPLGPGYQVPFASRVRAEAGVRTATVGLITEPEQAEDIVAGGHADIVLLARELLRDPYWPLRAAAKLGAPATWPSQYLRAT